MPRGASSWTVALAFLASSAIPVVGWAALSDGVTRWERDRRSEIEAWPTALRSAIESLAWLGEPSGIVAAVAVVGALCRFRYRSWSPALFVAGIVALAGGVAHFGADALQPWAERLQGELLDSQTRERFPAQAAMVAAAVWWNTAVHLRFLAPQASRLLGPVLVSAGAAAGLAPAIQERAEILDVAGGWVLGGVVAAIGGGIAVSVHRWGRQTRRQTGAAPIGGIEAAGVSYPSDGAVEAAAAAPEPARVRPVGDGDWVPETRSGGPAGVVETPITDAGPTSQVVSEPGTAGDGEDQSTPAPEDHAPVAAGATDGSDPLSGWVRSVASFFDGPGPDRSRGSGDGRGRSDR